MPWTRFFASSSGAAAPGAEAQAPAPSSDDPLRGWNAQATPGDATESHYIDLSESGASGLLVQSDPAFAAEPVELEAGQTFAGLEVCGRLGSGGMATVYRARDPQEDAEVALKLLNRGLVRDSRHLQRFRREARLASRLRHPRIVTIHTYGEEGGCAYLTMQLVDGPTLEEEVEREGPLAPARAAEVMEQVARAIDAAHRQRVVHRDLKPSNIMLHPTDGPLVLDFGLARDLGGDPTLTETGEILGTPAFLAPEQTTAIRDTPDHRIDIYGLGATLFYLLTGRHPHPGSTALEVIQHILDHDPPRIRTLDASLPQPLEVICQRALARDPRDRYQTAGDLADDLGRFLADEQIRARPPGRLQLVWRTMLRHPLTSALGVALVLLIASGAMVTRSLAARIALHQRSQQGLQLLEQAHGHARAGRHEEAEAQFLQAMLVTKGAFLEDPTDEALLVALARVKRERAAYAESRGNWSLAAELRVNLARLEGRPIPQGPPLAEAQRGTIAVQGLVRDREVVFHTWEGGRAERVAVANEDSPEVTLPVGEFLAVHTAADGRAIGSYLLVVDAGRRHEIRIAESAAAPPGVFRLPPLRVLEQVAEVHSEGAARQ